MTLSRTQHWHQIDPAPQCAYRLAWRILPVAFVPFNKHPALPRRRQDRSVFTPACLLHGILKRYFILHIYILGSFSDDRARSDHISRCLGTPIHVPRITEPVDPRQPHVSCAQNMNKGIKVFHRLGARKMREGGGGKECLHEPGFTS